MAQIRAFFAVEIINKKLLHAIGKLQEKLDSIIDRLKLVEIENLHITLRFLGNISEVTAKKLYDFLENEINPKYFKDGPLEFSVQKLSDFSKRVFHLGVKGPISVLREIHDEIESELRKTYGFKPEKKLKVHITLARARKNRNRSQSQPFPINDYNQLKSEYDSENVLGTFSVGKVFLKKSVLTPKGPIYSNLEF
jgi:2'-5' RNA ligase